MSPSTSAWSGERVAKPARADSIRSRVKGEAGPAANNPGLRAVLRRHAPSATRQRTLEANGIDCGAGPSRGVSLRSERRRAFQDNMRHDRLSQDADDEFPVDRGPGVGGSPAGVLGHDVHDGGRDFAAESSPCSLGTSREGPSLRVEGMSSQSRPRRARRARRSEAWRGLCFGTAAVTCGAQGGLTSTRCGRAAGPPVTRCG